jgi:hypothetical protein
MTHRIETLPQWTQALIKERDEQITALTGELERYKQAHAVLHDYSGWFTVHGPVCINGILQEPESLFFLSKDGAHRACSLGPGDLLLVGRANGASKVQAGG